MKKLLANRLLIIKIVLFFMLFFSSMIVVQYHGYTLFFILQLIFCIVMLFVTKSIVLIDSFFINSIYLMFFISTFAAFFSNISLISKKNAIFCIMLLVPMYFVVAYINSCGMRRKEIFDIIKKSVQIMCLVQLIWCMMQFFLYKVFTIDINDWIFVRIFHCVGNASCYRVDEYIPSGLSWHPALLAPIFVLSYCLFDNLNIKLLIIFDSLICGNSTALIGVIICVSYDLLRNGIKFLRNKQIKGKTIILILIALGIIGVIAIKTDIVGVAIEKIIYTYNRIIGTVDDGGSSLAHKRYFTAYPDVVKMSSLQQILFGYGENCSGYPFKVLFHQYVDVANWAVESDVMNILYSRGILGFVIYYAFLLYVAIRGYRINQKYLLLIFAIILEGITYNIQYEWVFFLEMIFLIAVTNNYDFFEKTNTTKKRL